MTLLALVPAPNGGNGGKGGLFGSGRMGLPRRTPRFLSGTDIGWSWLTGSVVVYCQRTWFMCVIAWLAR